MSDSRLRDLERRWRETGTVEDEAAYLTERVRAGDLGPERLELAAYCGHEAALVAMRGAALVPSLEAWVRGLSPSLGEGGVTLVALLAARNTLELWESQAGFDPSWMYAPRYGLFAAGRFLTAPTEEARRSLSSFAAMCAGLADPLDPAAVLPEELAAQCSALAFRALLDSSIEMAISAIVEGARARPHNVLRHDLADRISGLSLQRSDAGVKDAFRQLLLDELRQLSRRLPGERS